jgi:CDP-glycerol glycerophosphotransferase
MMRVGMADYIITDHGLHSLLFLKYASNIKYIDVWHGIPFKGFDQRDFALQRTYLATFVASPSMKDIYIKKYGFDESKVVVSGYARTDRLVLNGYNREEILDRSAIPVNKKIVMLAFTWSHNSFGAGDVPFDMDMSNLCDRLQNLADEIDVHFIYRSHLNSKIDEKNYDAVTFLPGSKYPDVEELLFISDALVSDWSSIVFDYLVLRRPTIFVDRPCPFNKGFTYGPEFRFGAIARTIDDLVHEIREVCMNGDNYMRRYVSNMHQVHGEVYGEFADGQASKRCMNWLLEHA